MLFPVAVVLSSLRGVTDDEVEAEVEIAEFAFGLILVGVRVDGIVFPPLVVGDTKWADMLALALPHRCLVGFGILAQRVNPLREIVEAEGALVNI